MRLQTLQRFSDNHRSPDNANHSSSFDTTISQLHSHHGWPRYLPHAARGQILCGPRRTTKKYKNYSQTWIKFKCLVYNLEAVTGSIRMTQLFTHHSSHSVGFRRSTWLWVRGYSRPAVKARVHSLATVSNQTTHQPLSISGSNSQDCSCVARIKRSSNTGADGLTVQQWESSVLRIARYSDLNEHRWVIFSLSLSNMCNNVTETKHVWFAQKSPASKQWKVDKENRAFNSSWEVIFLFAMPNNKPICLICHSVVAVAKKANLQRHYTTMHSDFEK